MNISICLPSRKRPRNLDRVYESAMDTAQQKDTIEFLFRLDHDDTTSLAEAKCLKEENTRTLIGPRGVLSAMWNEVSVLASSYILMQCGDDIVFRTPGWDQVVIQAFNQFPDGIALVHGRDLIHDQQFGTHCFVTRRWCEILGYFVPPWFCSDMADVWINDISNALGRRVYAPEVLTEHMHPSVGKALLDETHKERVRRGTNMNVRGLYEALRPRMLEDVEKLRAHMQPQKTVEGA